MSAEGQKDAKGKTICLPSLPGGGGGGGRRSGSPDAAFFELGSTLCILSVLSGKVTGT